MGTKLKQYQESGKIGVLSPIILILFGLIGGGVFGTIYSYGTHYIPFVYLNFLLTAGLGFVVGMVTVWAGKIGKVRNRKVMALFAFFNGLIALYVQWVVWVHILIEEIWIVKPLELWDAMQIIKEIGTWSLGRSSKIPVNGWFLGLIWIVEALIIVLFPVILSLIEDVYCETCKKWVTDETSIYFEPVEDVNQFLEIVECGNFEALREFEQSIAKKEIKNGLVVSYAICNTCKQVAHIRLEKVELGVDSKGREKIDKTTLLKKLMITRDHYNQLEEVRTFCN